MLSCQLSNAQTIKGGSVQGGTFGRVIPDETLEAWDGALGKVLNGTNVLSWNGMLNSGNTSSWQQYDSVNPTFTASHTTNAFPAIVFSPGATPAAAPRMRNNNLATLISGPNGGKNFSFYALIISQTNNNIASIALGNQSSSNNNASTFQFRTIAGALTTSTMAYGWDTNSTAIASGVAGSATTNQYMWVGFSSSNGTINIMQNLKVAQASRDVTGSQMTLNTCTLGGLNRTNDNFVLPGYCAITFLAWYTNWHEASTMTNKMNYFNATYKKGAYRAYSIAGQP